MPDESDLVKGVRGWLERQGYPLEMRVAAQFEKTDFHVLQSSYYVLPGEQPRELDVEAWFLVEDPRFRWQPTEPKTAGLREANDQRRAAITRRRAQKASPPKDDVYAIEIGAIVECKSGSAKRPWVAFTAGKRPSLDEVLRGHPMTDLAFEGFNRFLVNMPPDRTPVFAPVERYAYSVVPAPLGKDQNANPPKEPKAEDGYDIAYSAVKKAAEASRHMIERVNAGYGTRLVRVCVPTVVVSTPLVGCWLDDGELRFEERTSVVVQFSRPNPDGGAVGTFVHVVHESILPTFIASIRATIGVALENYSEFVDVIRRHNKRKDARAEKLRNGRSEPWINRASRKNFWGR